MEKITHHQKIVFDRDESNKSQLGLTNFQEVVVIELKIFNTLSKRLPSCFRIADDQRLSPTTTYHWLDLKIEMKLG